MKSDSIWFDSVPSFYSPLLEPGGSLETEAAAAHAADLSVVGKVGLDAHGQ